MKRRILVVIIAICGLTACKKTSVSPGLFGKWELRRSYWGLLYRDSSYSPGNGYIYEFGSDSSYKQFIKNKLTAQGKFHIIKVPDVGTGNTIIAFDNTQYGDPFSIAGTKITLGTSKDDGIASEYQKISN
jgi:hypothetical protein